MISLAVSMIFSRGSSRAYPFYRFGRMERLEKIRHAAATIGRLK